MNKYVKNGCISILVLVTLISTSSMNRQDRLGFVDITKSKFNIKKEIVPPVPLPPPPKIDRITLDDFKYRMALLETGNLKNPYAVVNQYGYTGKYQFGYKTLKGLVKRGYLDATYKELRDFKKSPELQERAMNALVKHNIDILKRYGLSKYVGSKIRGVTITLEGMLAGAHLVGPYAVKHFITTGSLSSVRVNGIKVSKYDGNGVSVLDYISKFENV